MPGHHDRRSDSLIRTTPVAWCGSSVSRTAQRVVYKPKDLGVDAAWSALVDRLNRVRAARGPACDARAYAVPVTVGPSSSNMRVVLDPRTFRSLLPARRCLAGVVPRLCRRRHASGEHRGDGLAPRPDRPGDDPAGGRYPRRRLPTEESGLAFASAMQKVLDSVATVGLLPAYGRHSTSQGIRRSAGLHSDSSPRVSPALVGRQHRCDATGEGGRHHEPAPQPALRRDPARAASETTSTT